MLCALSLLTFSPLSTAQEWSGTVLGFESPPDPVLGDMYGLRKSLNNNGFTFNLGYLNEIGWNGGGGYNHASHVAYIDQFALTFNQDLSRWTNIPDARIEANIVNRNHNDDLTTRRVQDPRVNVNDLTQESWGGQSITRLGWLTFARSFDDRRITWRIGMMNKVQTFDQIIPCDFQMLSQCGGKSANSLTWNNWNVHTWGTTLEYRLTPIVTLKGGVMEQNPDASSRHHAWSGSTRRSKGVLLPVEIEARPIINGLPGAYNLGVVFTNAPQTELYRGRSGGAGVSDPGGDEKHNRTGFLYAGLNQQLTRHQDDASRGLSTSFSMSLADQRTNYMHSVYAASLRYRGLSDARPEDWIGFGLTWTDMSNQYARNQRYMNTISGISDYNDAAYHPVPGHSLNGEFYYRFRPVSWLELQPGLQYWHRPAGIAHTQGAWVTELKTVVTF
ncbi:carbohydrate porin [Pantoea sp. B550]|uniref:carbohydrate porin n=1 Tax=Pantoea sp. B550 TaxID=2959338 RepID=UPI00209E9E11|nr:carbohydrate porin [Pantoea sp. B550]MCP1204323.1 carbohydrate porin [Pantoea sp. B550]